MELSGRQSTVVAVLAAGFVLIAWVMTSGGGGGSSESSSGEFDEITWCRAASGLSARADVLDPTNDGDAEDELRNLLVELQTAIEVAPATLKPDLARLNDLVVIVDQYLATGSTLEESHSLARAFTDEARLETSLLNVSSALVDCGHDPLP